MKKTIFLILVTVILLLPTLAESAGSGYPKPKYENCSDAQQDTMDDAYKKLTSAINDTKNCLGDDLRKKLQDKLIKEITVTYNTPQNSDKRIRCVVTCHVQKGTVQKGMCKRGRFYFLNRTVPFILLYFIYFIIF